MTHKELIETASRYTKHFIRKGEVFTPGEVVEAAVIYFEGNNGTK